MERNRVLVPLVGVECGAKTLPMIQQFLEPERTEIIILEICGFPEEVAALREGERIAKGTKSRVLRGSTEHRSAAPYQGTTAELKIDEEIVEEGTDAGRAKESKRQERAAKYRSLLQELHHAGYTASVKILFDGDPAGRIKEVAQVEEVDLIVMATRGKKGLSKVFAGDVGEAVLKKTTIPLLLARIE